MPGREGDIGETWSKLSSSSILLLCSFFSFSFFLLLPTLTGKTKRQLPPKKTNFSNHSQSGGWIGRGRGTLFLARSHSLACNTANVALSPSFFDPTSPCHPSFIPAESFHPKVQRFLRPTPLKTYFSLCYEQEDTYTYKSQLIFRAHTLTLLISDPGKKRRIQTLPRKNV